VAGFILPVVIEASMMTRPLIASVALALFLPAMAYAGPIERACLQSDRKAATRALCGCIQQVADMTLRGGDQRRAAGFFRDPDEAQKIKMSKRGNDDAFWDRYKAFGEQAEAYCAR
jgi:hypothetical protein